MARKDEGGEEERGFQNDRMKTNSENVAVFLVHLKG